MDFESNEKKTFVKFPGHVRKNDINREITIGNKISLNDKKKTLHFNGPIKIVFISFMLLENDDKNAYP